MRIISQTGMDFPYEQVIVYIDESSVMCKTLLESKRYCLGVYKDSERARAVFESIYDYYKGTPSMEDGETLYLGNVFVMPEK